MQRHYFRQKELSKRLANLANVLDHQFLSQSFEAIASFSRAKAFVYSKSKENASIWLAEALSRLFQKK